MIKFPKVHIAQSTVNRILNMYDGIQVPVVPQINSPDSPQVAQESQQLDGAFNAPKAPVAAPDQQTADAITLKPLIG